MTAYKRGREDIRTSLVRRFRDMLLLEWIDYRKPETLHMIKFSARAQRRLPSIGNVLRKTAQASLRQPS